MNQVRERIGDRKDSVADFRNGIDQRLDDRVRTYAFRFRNKIQKNPVPKNRQGQRADIFDGNMQIATGCRARFCGQQKV